MKPCGASDAMVEDMISLRENRGWSDRRIAKAVSAKHGREITESGVGYRLLSAGADIPPHRRRESKLPEVYVRNGREVRRFGPAEDAIIERLTLEGQTDREICDALVAAGHPRRRPHVLISRRLILARQATRAEGE